MNFLSAIKIFKKYGVETIDTKILNRLENDKRPYIQSFIEFNIYQILSYFIYNKLNVNHKFTTIKSGNLIINTNKSGPIVQSNIVLHPIMKNKHKEFLGYQALDESLMWLRKKLRYGKNATYDKENKKSLEIDNPQPSIYVHNDENMMKVQRLNGIGSEEFNQLL